VVSQYQQHKGFTLLELLVVVGIIAVIGGAMVASWSGTESKAARGVAAQTLSGIENSMRVFMQLTQRLPNNLESLVCTNYSATGAVSGNSWQSAALVDPETEDALLNTTAGTVTALPSTAYKFGGISNVSGVGGGMSRALSEKFVGTALTAAEADEFQRRGFLTLRYAMSEACDNFASSVVLSLVVNGSSGFFGDNSQGLDAIDIPNEAFADPEPDGAGGYTFRGVGFTGVVAAGAPVLMWCKGSDVTAGGSSYADNGYNNIKLGAGAHDRLLAFGIGAESDVVGADGVFGKAPFYAGAGKDKYAHYIVLFNSGAYTELVSGAGPLVSAAAPNTYLQAIIDASGRFLAEEMSEFNGQKSG